MYIYAPAENSESYCDLIIFQQERCPSPSTADEKDFYNESAKFVTSNYRVYSQGSKTSTFGKMLISIDETLKSYVENINKM